MSKVKEQEITTEDTEAEVGAAGAVGGVSVRRLASGLFRPNR